MSDPTEHFQRQWEDMDPMTAEINRLLDANAELKEIIRDLIQGARRDVSIISRKSGPLHVIETRMTKGQVLRAIQAASEKDTPAPEVTVGEAALLVADEIDKDPNAFNALQAGFKPEIDAPMRHFFSKALRHYAAALRARAGEKGDG